MKVWEEKAKEAYLHYEDEPTFIKAYKKDKHYIVHGEITIYCFNQEFEKEWEFFARDIWVTQDGSDALRLYDEYIELKDWLGYVYRLDYLGNTINDKIG